MLEPIRQILHVRKDIFEEERKRAASDVTEAFGISGDCAVLGEFGERYISAPSSPLTLQLHTRLSTSFHHV